MLADTSNLIVRAFLAPVCACCDAVLDRPLGDPICPVCALSMPAFTPAMAAAEPPLEFVAAMETAGHYDGALRDMIHALKYRKRRMIAPFLAARMRARGAALLVGSDAVVPIPLHPLRFVQRGFNQAEDLAAGLGVPLRRLLRRSRWGPPQASLSGADRHRNARGAYAVSLYDRFTRRHRIRDATLTLIDDVVTTGATMEECARVLREAGAREIRVLSAARASEGRRLPRPL